jgi:hypothetical protein
MKILAAIKREERKLEKQLGKLRHQLNGIRAAAKALGDSTNRALYPPRWTLRENPSSQPGRDLARKYKTAQNFRNWWLRISGTHIYSDYRNTPVCLDEAILFSVASLAGNAATDQELQAARKKGAVSSCK